MTETTDDKLLQQFFSDNRKEIEDNGFSRRVMHHLPDRYYRISQLWSLFCFTLAVVLFFVLDGLQLVLGDQMAIDVPRKGQIVQSILFHLVQIDTVPSHQNT